LRSCADFQPALMTKLGSSDLTFMALVLLLLVTPVQVLLQSPAFCWLAEVFVIRLAHFLAPLAVAPRSLAWARRFTLPPGAD
jgi:hypothetical protein